jgi:23S rRNA (guanosine2251-2'-O)-methyltransferase
LDIIYGRNPVLEALRAGRPARRIVLAENVRADSRIGEILERARAAGISVEESSRRRLDDIAHTEHHQGVAGYFHTRPALTVEALVRRLRAPALVVALDGVQDPQNLGAIARTAEACGADGLVLARHRASAVTGAAAKASAGAIEHLAVAAAPNLVRALETLGAAGLWRVGLDAQAPSRYDTVDYRAPLALVLGAEGAGLRPLVRRSCDVLVALPMLGRIESLNVGAAAAALLYEVQRQRGFERRSVG